MVVERSGGPVSRDRVIADAGTADAPITRPGPVLAVFAAYGALWGPYLSLLPDVREATGANEAQLGVALLAGGLAAMPAMWCVGRLLDRFGRPVAVVTAVLFALSAVSPTLAGSVPQLIVALTMFGAGSGAFNVVAVALAATFEVGTGKRVMNRAHALFPVGVLTCSVTTGIARSNGVSGRVVAASLALALVLAAVMARGRIPHRFVRQGKGPGGRGRLGRPALLLCLLAALATVIESGVQQWSAVFMADVVQAPIGLSAVAPGAFAVGMATGRLSGHWLSGRIPDRTLLLASGVISGAGALTLSVAEIPALGLVGTAAVGAGVSVAAPTAFGIVGRHAAPEERGAVLGSTVSLASVGFLVGPALVGQVSQLFDLRVAIAALSMVSLAVVLLASRLPAGARYH